MNFLNTNTELVVILGPTASGKTALGVELAGVCGGEIISADSRQVYRKMDIGTGKDLSEYVKNGQSVPYHLIDICEAGHKYNVSLYQHDFSEAFEQIQTRKQLPILSGGTGLYIQSVLSDLWKVQVPVNEELRSKLEVKSIDQILSEYGYLLIGYVFSTKKRLIRKVELEYYLDQVPQFNKGEFNTINYKIFGLNPNVEFRRKRISVRLKERFEKQGMVNEVESLLNAGIPPETLEYYGLEYKYICYYLTGKMSFEDMFVKLETEIHRYAKRQMTFFRSMERKGFEINWIPEELNMQQKLDFIKNILNTNG